MELETITDSEKSRAPTIAYRARGKCYLNVTSRCTLRCSFCPKYNHCWILSGANLRLQHEPTLDEVLAAVGDPRVYEEIVFCGLGEPTLRLYDVVEMAAELHQHHARRVRIDTDGLANLVYGRDVTPDLEGPVDALSVSLNAQNTDVYEHYCRPTLPHSYAAMLDFADRARDFVPDITLTAIDGLPGVDIAACAEIARHLGVKFRPRVLDAVG